MVMYNLVRRYVSKKAQDSMEGGVTEDDLNEIKQDISSFRFELVEILRNNGMFIPSKFSIASTKTSKSYKALFMTSLMMFKSTKCNNRIMLVQRRSCASTAGCATPSIGLARRTARRLSAQLTQPLKRRHRIALSPHLPATISFSLTRTRLENQLMEMLKMLTRVRPVASLKVRTKR